MTIGIHFLLCWVYTEEMDDIHSLCLSMHLIVLYIDTDGLQARGSRPYVDVAYRVLGYRRVLCTAAQSRNKKLSPPLPLKQIVKGRRRRGMRCCCCCPPLPSFISFILSNRMYTVRERGRGALHSLLLRAFFGFRHLNFR